MKSSFLKRNWDYIFAIIPILTFILYFIDTNLMTSIRHCSGNCGTFFLNPILFKYLFSISILSVPLFFVINIIRFIINKEIRKSILRWILVIISGLMILGVVFLIIAFSGYN